MSFVRVSNGLWHCNVKGFEAYGSTLSAAMTNAWNKFQKHRELLMAR